MKKLLLGLTFVTSSLILVGCGGTDENSDYGRFDYESTGGSTYVYTDTKTGCKYLNIDDGVTPLLNQNGQPDCSSKNNDF